MVTEQLIHVICVAQRSESVGYKYSRFTRAPPSSIEYHHILHFKYIRALYNVTAVLRGPRLARLS